MNHDLVQQYEMYPRHIHDFTTPQGQVKKNIVTSHVNAPKNNKNTHVIIPLAVGVDLAFSHHKTYSVHWNAMKNSNKTDLEETSEKHQACRDIHSLTVTLLVREYVYLYTVLYHQSTSLRVCIPVQTYCHFTSPRVCLRPQSYRHITSLRVCIPVESYHHITSL